MITRSWVQISPGAGLFFYFNQPNNVYLIWSEAELQHHSLSLTWNLRWIALGQNSLKKTDWDKNIFVQNLLLGSNVLYKC